MVVNAIIEVGRRHAAPLAPTRQVAQPASMRPRARVVNIPKDEMRHYEAIMEARRAAQAMMNDLQSATNALSAANADNDRLSGRVKSLESENARLRRELEGAKQECLALSKALEGLKSEASPKPDSVVPEGNPVQPAPEPAKRRRKKNKRNEAEMPVTADGAVQQ